MFENIVLHAMWFVLAALNPVDQATLAHDWDATNPYQVERAYCATVRLAVYHNKENPADLTNGQAIVLVDSGSVRATVDSAPGEQADEYHVTPDCADNDSTIIIHTHTPTTCTTTTHCEIGGGDAWQCLPSDVDLVWTAKRKLHIGGVQCETHAIVFFSPVIKGPPPPAKKNGSQRSVKRVNLGVVTRQGPGSAWRPLNRQPSR